MAAETSQTVKSDTEKLHDGLRYMAGQAAGRGPEESWLRTFEALLAERDELAAIVRDLAETRIPERYSGPNPTDDIVRRARLATWVESQG